MYDNDTGALTKLKQTGSVKDYYECFEELANRTKRLPEEFFVSCFISGLKEDIQPVVQMFGPTSMLQALGLAKSQEEQTEATGHVTEPSCEPQENNKILDVTQSNNQTPENYDIPPIRKINQAGMDE